MTEKGQTGYGRPVLGCRGCALPASLRVFEGCARAYIGRVEGANLIKLNRLEPRIST